MLTLHVMMYIRNSLKHILNVVKAKDELSTVQPLHTSTHLTIKEGKYKK